jgi:hypothetical protein
MVSDELREQFATLLHAHVFGLRISGTKAVGHVPWRENEHPSLTADLEKCVWYDLARQEGGGVKEFKARLGLNGREQQVRKVVATYDYTDETGTLLFQVLRFDPKGFAQRRPDGNGGWLYNLDGIRRVLYKLSFLVMASTVYLVEGEKDADRLWSLGLPATTCPGGAGKWRAEYNESLRGKRVVILPDNDEAGEQHATKVARSLLTVAKAVKVVCLPGLPEKGDVSEWLDAGHTKDELAELVKETAILKPEALRTEHKPQSNGLPLTKLPDLLNEPEEEVSWLVDKLLPTSGFSLLVAKPKAGKSTLARNLALAVARGEPFLNRATQKGAVIYLALEEKRAEVRKHFREMGATGEEEIYVFAASAPADALQKIRAVVEEKKPALIIIDPLFRLARVKDGNDYAQVTHALEPLLVLARETGAHVLCVHHAGKTERNGGDAILGSTAIFAAVDTALVMKRSERYRTIQSIQRYGEDLSETVLRFDPATRTVALGESKEREETQRMKDAIADFLALHSQPVSEAEIKENVDGNNRVQQTALREMVSEKRVERTGSGSKGDPYRFSLSHFSIYQKSRSENLESDLSPQEDSANSHFSTSQFSESSEVSKKSESEHFQDDTEVF